jgi:hypothetical protein
MPNELAGDVKLALTQIENALITCRVAERAASDVEAALKRIDATLKSRPKEEPPQHRAEAEPLAVSRAEAARLLSRNRQTIWRFIRNGRLDVTADDQITMESIRRLAGPKARPR